MNQALRRILAKDLRNLKTTIVGNWNAEERNGRERGNETRKTQKENGWETKVSGGKDAQTWRKTHSSKNQSGRDARRAEMSFLRERATRLGKALIVLVTERRRNERKTKKSRGEEQDDRRGPYIKPNYWRGKTVANWVEK